MAGHHNAPLTSERRRRLCERVDSGRPIAHVAVRQPLAHRLDRLAPPVQHQAPQIALAPPPLIPPRQRPEHIGNELRQLAPQPFRFPQLHPGRRLPTASRDHST
nr:Integrase catalytic subunit [Streptomyces sp. F8]